MSVHTAELYPDDLTSDERVWLVGVPAAQACAIAAVTRLVQAQAQVMSGASVGIDRDSRRDYILSASWYDGAMRARREAWRILPSGGRVALPGYFNHGSA